tara:strand:- start:819 stop:1046 length:228 start_codon:yes stop_codon:yes gene_type:complete
MLLPSEQVVLLVLVPQIKVIMEAIQSFLQSLLLAVAEAAIRLQVATNKGVLAVLVAVALLFREQPTVALTEVATP